MFNNIYLQKLPTSVAKIYWVSFLMLHNEVHWTCDCFYDDKNLESSHPLEFIAIWHESSAGYFVNAEHCVMEYFYVYYF